MKEIRTADITADKPKTAAEEELILVGKPIVYDQPTTIRASFGEYTEIIKRGALDNADLSDIRLLYNHDANKLPLARTGKTMTFNLGAAGLEMRAVLPDTQEGRSVYTAVERGDLSGMSFGFKVANDGSHYDAKTNTRTITKIDKVYEFSITPFPAYPQTSLEARSQMESAKTAVHDEMKKAALINLNKILFKGGI